MSTNTFKWQLYISAYTALLGIPLLFFPESGIPLMGFDPDMAVEGPFVQLTGMFLLSLTLITFRIWQKKTAEMVLGTVVVRIFIITSLLYTFPLILIRAPSLSSCIRCHTITPFKSPINSPVSIK